MVAPTGGLKDITAPKVLNILEKETAILTEFHFIFDEYIQLNNWEEYFYVSPPFNKRPQKKINGQTLIITIEDSLFDDVTYHISLSNCIKDLNEGNITDSLSFMFGPSEYFDTLNLSGKLADAYTLDALENTWIMLFEESRNDSTIFKDTPNYIAKTDKNGSFNFPNLNAKNYNIVALTDFDFIYNEEEKIAFNNTTINAEKDSFISLLAFNPIVKIDSTINDTTAINADSTTTDSLLIEEVVYGNLAIITIENSPCVFQLLQNEKVIIEFIFAAKPYDLLDITPGKYQLKYIADSNTDGEWTTGNWKSKTQAEEVTNYPSEITIRSNWDLELEWDLE